MWYLTSPSSSGRPRLAALQEQGRGRAAGPQGGGAPLYRAHVADLILGCKIPAVNVFSASGGVTKGQVELQGSISCSQELTSWFSSLQDQPLEIPAHEIPSPGVLWRAGFAARAVPGASWSAGSAPNLLLLFRDSVLLALLCPGLGWDKQGCVSKQQGSSCFIQHRFE